MDLSNNLKAHLSNMYRLAMCDDELDLSEQMLLFKIAQEHGISEEYLGQWMSERHEQVTIPERIEDRITHLYDLSCMVWADGKATEAERQMLRNFVLRYEFLPDNADAIVEYFLQAIQEQRSVESIISEFQAS